MGNFKELKAKIQEAANNAMEQSNDKILGMALDGIEECDVDELEADECEELTTFITKLFATINAHLGNRYEPGFMEWAMKHGWTEMKHITPEQVSVLHRRYELSLLRPRI